LKNDRGWNAFVLGEKFDETATLSWKDGYRDAKEIKEIKAIEIFPNLSSK
jgi:hypothetical protein